MQAHDHIEVDERNEEAKARVLSAGQSWPMHSERSASLMLSSDGTTDRIGDHPHLLRWRRHQAGLRKQTKRQSHQAAKRSKLASTPNTQ